MNETAPTKTFCEFFAGVGLVAAGLRTSGWQCVYANDIDVHKQRQYLAAWGGQQYFHLADVNDTDAIIMKIPNHPFLAAASFPCTDLSLAGMGRGFEGKQSSAFFGFANVLKSLGDRKPPLVMLENVVGFLHATDGTDFRRAATTLGELGYSLDLLLIDARWFTPQSRPRVFLIGVHESIMPAVRAAELLESDDFVLGLEDSPLRPNAVLAAIRSVPISPSPFVSFKLPAIPDEQHPFSSVVDRNGKWWTQEETNRHWEMLSDRHRERLEEFRRKKKPFIGSAFRRIRGGHQRLEVRFDGLAGCLRTPRGGSARQIVVQITNGDVRMRWMTPTEYAKLQGVPELKLVGSVSQQLFGLADAVCVPSVHWLDQAVLTPVFNAVAVVKKRGSRKPRSAKPKART
jgi:DNA (cytosine-5)-methyltransferase 1